MANEPRISPNSWLRFSEYAEIETGGFNFRYYELSEMPGIEVQDDDILHTVISTDRIDRMSYHYYGTSKLWWVIALANGLDNPMESLNQGEELVIPSARYVREDLLR